LLANGKLLVVGGWGNSGLLSSSEIYDYVSGTWTSNAVLSAARDFHTATLLPSGLVLVTGGGNALPSSAFYDPAVTPPTGTWSNSGALTNLYLSATLTPLPSGKVLIAGSRSAEFDYISGAWIGAGNLTTARLSHTSTLLPNGKVLTAGGLFSVYYSSAELYDPTSRTWTNTGSMNTRRGGHSATLLDNGKVLVAGGKTSSGSTGFLASAELYDPAAETWTPTGSMPAARWRHTATLLPGKKLLVAGGEDSTGFPTGTALYDPTSGAWTPTGTLSSGRAYHTATLLPNGKVLVAGGTNANGYLASAALFDPATGNWTTIASLPSARWLHSATFLPNGKVLVAGGQNSGGPLSDAALYDPAKGTWTTTGPMIYAKWSHSAALLPDGNVLITGGSGFGLQTNSQVFATGLIPADSWRPQMETAITPYNLGSSFVITGSSFRGVAGGSSGNTSDSSSDYPLVQLRAIESSRTSFLLATNWSTNSFTSVPVWNFPPGWAMATVFVNGIPSTSSIVNITVPTPVATTLTNARRSTNGAFQFSFTNNVGALFGVLATTNVALASSNWTALGGVTEAAPGQFQFTDAQATNFPRRIYRLHSR
jgi:N-acetylneuraminic acid mutarotase